MPEFSHINSPEDVILDENVPQRAVIDGSSMNNLFYCLLKDGMVVDDGYSLANVDFCELGTSLHAVA